ncbi:MAG: N-acetylmuramic acid 6-phosphate etherase [Alphaproteobacteria bacterium]|nr:N-acetylmuramic acid 6-phosphate etherase [Alphaproteobacteria bacterium]
MIAVTEKTNPNTIDIDVQNGEQIARLINNEDAKIAQAIQKITPQIGQAIEEISIRLRNGGRMAYFGSGTSGRIGVLDASEMSPTYGVSPSLIQAFISGGEEAIRFAVENAEDREDMAVEDFNTFNPTDKDIVVAISASGNPQYTYKVLELARQKQILTIAVTSNPEAKFKPFADIFLCSEVGPEAVSGSSRMKSGTAQKMILNMLSTGAMIRLGKTYHNYMIDVQIHNQKLRERGIRYINEITGADEQTAAQTLETAQNVKTACVMLLKKCDKPTAEKMLADNEGILRKII